MVFAELSTDATIAAGNAVKGSTARWMVETILANVPNAGWGEIVRVAAGQPAAEPDLGAARGKAAAGVIVVTTRRPQGSQVGVTANSFAAVSRCCQPRSCLGQ